MELKTIGVVGVGGMGLAMAEKLIGAGFDVIGYRRSAMDDLIAAGGRAATSSSQVAKEADVVIVCLPSIEAVDEIMTRDDGLAAALRPGQIVIETTTLSVADKRRVMEKAAESGAVLLDCPISGTPGMMRAHRAAFFASGDKAAFETCRPILEAMAPNVSYVGDVGGGTAAKFVANMLVGIHVTASAEALAFAVREGADPVAIHDAISGSVASSAMFELRGGMMARRDYGQGGATQGFLNLMGTVAKEMESVGARSPLLDHAMGVYRAAIENGFNSPDQAVIFEYLLEQQGDGK